MTDANTGSRSSYPQLLHDFFDRAAFQWPNEVAIDVPPGTGRPTRRTFTYSEIQGRVDALAAHLRGLIDGEARIAILLNRNAEHLYVAQLAVMKAGGAYVCLDSSFPEEQIREILRDSGSVALLTDSPGLERAVAHNYPTSPILDVSRFDYSSPAILAPSPWLNPHTLAYMIYTSGTTGKPKGVMIEHRSVVNLVAGDVEAFRLGPGDRIAQNSSPAYDSSVEEIWLSLAVGATLVVVDEETIRLGPDLVPWLREERIHVLCPPPTLLRTTGCEEPHKELPDMRVIYVGGEALTRDVADKWSVGIRLVNGYGPTECAITATRIDIHPGDEITVGPCIPGMDAVILDENLNEVPQGVQGELCMRGIGLARGYHNRPELTAEKFVEHPVHGRIYRTGDLSSYDAHGNLLYHGRIDTQVKVRGYRIELEAIETVLALCPGVLEAACRVQGPDSAQMIAAHIVPADSANPPSFDELRARIREELPPYMMPGLFGMLDELPKSVGGKIKRNALPELEHVETESDRPIVAPRNEVEKILADAVRTTLSLHRAVSVDEDFFHDLGGTSLQAAQLISLLRKTPQTASITVRDLYEARTVANLAPKIEEGSATTGGPRYEPRPMVSSLKATIVQSIWLAGELFVGALIAYVVAFKSVPSLLSGIGLLPLLLLSPVFAFAGVLCSIPLSVGVTVLTKRLLIGKYVPTVVPVWGDLFVRNWIVMQVARLIPWQTIAGTELTSMVLRALGAKVGKRLHVHRGVDFGHGGWDLLDIGDDVTIGQDATLRLYDLEDRQIRFGSIQIGSGTTLELRAGLGPDTVMEPNSYLTNLSSLPAGAKIEAGERWDGIPAKPVGTTAPPPAVDLPGKVVSPMTYSVAKLFAQCLLWAYLALPIELLTYGAVAASGEDAGGLFERLLHGELTANAILSFVLIVVVSLPLSVILEGLACRALGKLRPGVMHRWSLGYIAVWMKAGLVDSANEWLSGTLLWPPWLRLAGMKLGKGCEISTISDVVPELVEIGPMTFFADGIYLGGPLIHRGTVMLAPIKLGTNVFLGNHAVIPAGTVVPEDVLLGVCTPADKTQLRPNSSWFGHPPFELPRREIIEVDRSLTHNPTPIRYFNRLIWEVGRFALPITPSALGFLWIRYVGVADAVQSPLMRILVTIPLATFLFVLAHCLLIWVMKWGLLGRVKPGIHPLYSCWCSRWDFLYVAWGLFARNTLTLLEGTELLTIYLRWIGMKLGKGVVLGHGFSQVVDPDMITIEDGATVSAAFQAHTFEDRVLKIDYVRIGKDATVCSNTVPLYGANVGDRCYVAPHSVIMKEEHLLPDRTYAGAPTRPMADARAVATRSDG